MRILVTGAAASGKSAFAEQRALELGTPLVYIASMRVQGAEDSRRVQRHRALRAGKGFSTLEAPSAHDLAETAHLIPNAATVLLEDLGNLVSNTLFDERGSMRDAAQVHDEMAEALALLASGATHLIAVTNEVGSGIAPKTDEIDTYIRLLGRLSCECAALYDEVYEVTCGMPARIK